ncbi:hypothetical protein H8356DRAFT_1422426 [Neocallimastix lanati (nom. inval.)]|nr:hypothetical protein H8356DRAFT_1422426 [Neocallimastix sp. JGI-2020a]
MQPGEKQLGEMQHFNTTPLGEMQPGEMQFGEMQLSPLYELRHLSKYAKEEKIENNGYGDENCIKPLREFAADGIFNRNGIEDQSIVKLPKVERKGSPLDF